MADANAKSAAGADANVAGAGEASGAAHERSCMDCGLTGCAYAGRGKPDFCLSDAVADDEYAEVMARYAEDENARIMRVASEVECEFYCSYTRVQELIEFSRRMGFSRIGIATCAGLVKESRILTRLLERAGFQVFGIACKVTETKKVDLGLPPEHERAGVNACNPLMQAHLLEEARTDLNVVMGLCMGHDILFNKYSHTLTTTLVVKDRVTGHNPCVGLYASDSLYRKRINAQIDGYAEEAAE